MDTERIIEKLKTHKVKILAVVGVIVVAVFGIDEETWQKISEVIVDLTSDE